jgi:hypothetical protein
MGSESDSYRHAQHPMSPMLPYSLDRVRQILPIVMALVLLPAIAFASPLDPSWVVGIYDGADGDDIATLIAENAAANTPLRERIPPPVCLSAGLCGLGRCAVHGLHTSMLTRGPPPTRVSVTCTAAHVSKFSLDSRRPQNLGRSDSVPPFVQETVEERALVCWLF